MFFFALNLDVNDKNMAYILNKLIYNVFLRQLRSWCEKVATKNAFSCSDTN